MGGKGGILGQKERQFVNNQFLLRAILSRRGVFWVDLRGFVGAMERKKTLNWKFKIHDIYNRFSLFY